MYIIWAQATFENFKTLLSFQRTSSLNSSTMVQVRPKLEAGKFAPILKKGKTTYKWEDGQHVRIIAASKSAMKPNPKPPAFKPPPHLLKPRHPSTPPPRHLMKSPEDLKELRYQAPQPKHLMKSPEDLKELRYQELTNHFKIADQTNNQINDNMIPIYDNTTKQIEYLPGHAYYSNPAYGLTKLNIITRRMVEQNEEFDRYQPGEPPNLAEIAESLRRYAQEADL